MIERIEGKRHKRQFDSLMDVVHWLQTTPPVWSCRYSRTAGMGDLSWTLGHSYDDCVRLVRDGWSDGVKSLSALAATVPTAVAYEHRYDIAGERADVPRYLSGDPLHMVTRGKVRKPKPAITIAVNVRANSGVGGREMANFGAAVVALIDRMESRGLRVELLGLYGDDGRSHRHCYSWTIKRAEDALDLSAVAFSLAHPGMFRRIGFAIAERSLKQNETPGYGFGGGITREDFIDLPEEALLINGVDDAAGSCRSMEQALRFAEERINAAAIELTGEPIAELEEAA